MPNGPSTHWRQTTDTVQTNNPADRRSTVSATYKALVTLDWDFHRHKLSRTGVRFTAGTWLGAGKGPVDVYEHIVGGKRKKTGRFKWAVTTGFLQKTETDRKAGKFRYLYTPFIRMVRVFDPVGGGTSAVTELPQNSAGLLTERGSWQKVPVTK